MSAFNKAISDVTSGDVFESGKILGFTDEPIVWVVNNVEETDVGREVELYGYYMDVLVKEETVVI